MTKGKISDAVISERALWVRRMVSALRALPLQREQEFLADQRNIAAAESYLRRALEALFDIGRHILAKGFGLPTSEYKEIMASPEKNVQEMTAAQKLDSRGVTEMGSVLFSSLFLESVRK